MLILPLEWIFRILRTRPTGRSILQFDGDDDNDNDDDAGGDDRKRVEMQSRLYNWDVVESGCDFFFLRRPQRDTVPPRVGIDRVCDPL